MLIAASLVRSRQSRAEEPGGAVERQGTGPSSPPPTEAPLVGGAASCERASVRSEEESPARSGPCPKSARSLHPP